MERRDEVSDREKPMIQSPKLMQTFMWNPHGFQVVDAMPSQNERSSRSPTRSEIFPPRSLFGMERGERRLAVHADNARPHTRKVTRAFCYDNFLRIAPHSLHLPYSSDLAPSDFSWFFVWASQTPPPRTAIRVCL
jgi:hypothetical protein